MPGDLWTVLGIISLSSLSLAHRLDWRDTQRKWPLARNPDRSRWHRHTILKLLWPQPIAPWTVGPHYHPFHPTDATDVTLGANSCWLGIRTGARGVATLTSWLFGCSPWLWHKKNNIWQPHRSTRLLQLTGKWQYDWIMWLALRSVKSNNVDFLNQNRYFSTILTRLGWPRSIFKIVEVPGIEPATSWSVVSHDSDIEKKKIDSLSFQSLGVYLQSSSHIIRSYGLLWCNKMGAMIV